MRHFIYPISLGSPDGSIVRTFCLRHAAHALTFLEMLGILGSFILVEPLVELALCIVAVLVSDFGCFWGLPPADAVLGFDRRGLS